VNKKKQKNFNSFGSRMFQHRAKRSKKVFWFFFQKRTSCSSYLATPEVHGFGDSRASIGSNTAAIRPPENVEI
jgi:hypothetical protein